MLSDKYQILLVTRWFGGIRTFIRYVYNHFDSSLYHFTILAPKGPLLETLLKELNNLDVECIPIEKNPSTLKFLKIVTKTIISGNFDLIHSQGFTAGITSVISARLSKTPHLMTSHDVLLSKQFAGLKGYLKKKILSTLLPKIDVIHSVSNDAQNNLIKYVPILKRYKQKLIVIQNAIETKDFKDAEKRDLRKELNLSNGTFLIGFLGRFMKQKGFIYLVKALDLLLKASDLPKQPLIVTFGEGCFIREEKANIKKKGLDKYIYFLPFTPNVASAIKGLDVVVMPSLWEANGMLALEAMVVGTPVIGTDCIGLRESLKDTPSIIVPAGDSIALAGALCQEIKNPSRARAEAFREEAAVRFDVKKEAAKLEKVILELLGHESSC